MSAIRVRTGWLVLALLAACGGDDDAEPGTELAPCVEGLYCESPLQCVDELCVHPDQIGGGTGSTPGDGGSAPGDGGGDGSLPGDTSAGSADGGSTPVPGDSNGGNDGGGGDATVYCTEGESEGCFCGHTADYGPPDAPCSQGTVTSPNRCCADEGWPAYGGCVCWTLSCRQVSADTCYCGIGSAEPEEAVGSCSTPDEGGACCLDDDQGTCTCSTAFLPGTCPDGGSSVGSCSVASLGCGSDSAVSACN